MLMVPSLQDLVIMFEVASAKERLGGSQADGNTKQVIARAPSRFRRSEYTHLKGDFKLYLMLMVPSLQDLQKYKFVNVVLRSAKPYNVLQGCAQGR